VLPSQGITPNDVGTHSPRAGGTMALKLNGISHTTIKSWAMEIDGIPVIYP